MREERVNGRTSITQISSSCEPGIPNEIEFEVVIKCRIPCVGRCGDEQRITVRRCSHDRLRGNISTRPRPILDDELLAKALR